MEVVEALLVLEVGHSNKHAPKLSLAGKLTDLLDHSFFVPDLALGSREAPTHGTLGFAHTQHWRRQWRTLDAKTGRRARRTIKCSVHQLQLRQNRPKSKAQTLLAASFFHDQPFSRDNALLLSYFRRRKLNLVAKLAQCRPGARLTRIRHDAQYILQLFQLNDQLFMFLTTECALLLFRLDALPTQQYGVIIQSGAWRDFQFVNVAVDGV